jgi:ABC-2 type transport system ATP-binding protein
MTEDTRAAIEMNLLEKSFGEVVALHGLDLVVEPGIVFGLLGPNGAVKTTLVRVLATLLRPSGGRASVLGQMSSPSRLLFAVGLDWPASSRPSTRS